MRLETQIPFQNGTKGGAIDLFAKEKEGKSCKKPRISNLSDSLKNVFLLFNSKIFLAYPRDTFSIVRFPVVLTFP